MATAGGRAGGVLSQGRSRGERGGWQQAHVRPCGPMQELDISFERSWKATGEF